MAFFRARSAAGALFARACPSEIQIFEEYFYEAALTGRPFVRPEPRPFAPAGTDNPVAATGRLAAIFPYDGQKSFSRLALADVTREVREAASNDAIGELDARVGYLALAGFDRSNLDAIVGPAAADTVLPLDIPVYNGTSLATPAALVAARNAAHLTVDYLPLPPEVVPIEIAIQVSDEDTLRSERMALARADGELELAEARRTLSRRVSRADLFLQALTIRLDVRLTLTAACPGPPPEIKWVALEWPLPSSYRNVRLRLGPGAEAGGDYPLHYKRQPNRLEWGGISFYEADTHSAEHGTQTGGGRAAGNGCVYDAPAMILQVVEPDEFFTASRLSGEMMIEIPVPLSGGAVSYFDALGRERQVAIKRRSRLNVKLEIDLLDCFRSRSLSPYQHIHFPRVILDDQRLSEIKALLRGEGFTLEEDALLVEGEGDGERHHLLSFSRPEGPGRLRLWLRVEGRPMPTMRERQIPNGERYTTLRESGDIVIYLRAELEGDHRRPVEVMNQIHRLLKTWFERLRLPR